MPYEALQKKLVGAQLPSLPDDSLVAKRLSTQLEHLDRLQQRHDDIVKRLDENTVERRGVINHQLNPRGARVERFLGETQAKKAHRNLEKEKNIIIREVAPVGREISNVLRDANLAKDIQADIANFESRKLAKENEKKEAEKDANNASAVAILSREIEKLEQGIVALKKFLDEIKDEKNITKMIESVNKFVTDKIRSGISAADVVEAREKMMTLGGMNAKEKVADSHGVTRIAKKYTGADGKVHTADYEKTKDGITSKANRSCMKKNWGWRWLQWFLGLPPDAPYMGAAERKARNEIDYNTYEEEGIDTSHDYDLSFYPQEKDEEVKEWHQKNFCSFVDHVLVKSNEELSSVGENPVIRFKDEYMVFDPALQILEADKPEAERSSKHKKYLEVMWARNNRLHDNNFDLTGYKYYQTLLLGEVKNQSTFPQAVNAKNAAHRAKHHAELALNIIQRAIDKLPERYTSAIELATNLQELDAARVKAQQVCDAARSVAQKMRAEYEHQKLILSPGHSDVRALESAVKAAEKAVSAADLKLAEADKIRTQLTRPVAPDLQEHVRDSVFPSSKLLEALVPIVVSHDDSVMQLATIIVDGGNPSLPTADRAAVIRATIASITTPATSLLLINQALKLDPQKAMQVLEVAHKKLLDRTAPDVEERIVDIFETVENGAAGLVSLNQNTAGTAAGILQANLDASNEIVIHNPKPAPGKISNVTKAVAIEVAGIVYQDSANGIVSSSQFGADVAAEILGKKTNTPTAVQVLKHSDAAQKKITTNSDHKPMAQVFYTSAAARRTLKDSAIQLKVLNASLEGRNFIANNPEGMLAVSSADNVNITVTASVLAQDIHQDSAGAAISHSDTAARAGAIALILLKDHAAAKLRKSEAGLNFVIKDPAGVGALLQTSEQARAKFIANDLTALTIVRTSKTICKFLATNADSFQLIAQTDPEAIGRALSGDKYKNEINRLIAADIDFVCEELANDLESFLEVAKAYHITDYNTAIPVNATKAERVTLLKTYFNTHRNALSPHPNAFDLVKKPAIRQSIISMMIARHPEQLAATYLHPDAKLQIVTNVLQGQHGETAIRALRNDVDPATYKIVTDGVEEILKRPSPEDVRAVIDTTTESERRDAMREALISYPDQTIQALENFDPDLPVNALTIMLRENNGRALDDIPEAFKTDILKNALNADPSAINAPGVTGGAKLDIATKVFTNGIAGPKAITRLNNVNVHHGLPLIGKSTPILDEAIDVAFNVSTRVATTDALAGVPGVYDNALKAGMDGADAQAVVNGLREVPQNSGDPAFNHLTPALSAGLQADNGRVFNHVISPELRVEILADTLDQTKGEAFTGVTNPDDRKRLLTIALLTVDEAEIKGGAINSANSVAPAVTRRALTSVVKLNDPAVQNHINTILNSRTAASLAANNAITALASIVFHVDYEDPEAIDGLTDILTNQYMRENPSEDREVITLGMRGQILNRPEEAIRNALAIQDIETLSILITAYDNLVDSNNPATNALARFVSDHPASAATIRALSSVVAGDPIEPQHIDEARKKDPQATQKALNVATAVVDPKHIGTAIDAHPKARKVGEIVIDDAAETIKAAKSRTPLTKVVDDIELEISAKALSAEENKASPHIIFAAKRIVKALYNLNLDPAMRVAMLPLGTTPPITQEMVAEAIEENPYQVFRNIQGHSPATATAVLDAIKNTVTSQTLGLSDTEIRDMAKIDLEVAVQIIIDLKDVELNAIAKLIPSPPAAVAWREAVRLKSAVDLLKDPDPNKRRDVLMAAMATNPKSTRRLLDKIIDHPGNIGLVRQGVLSVVGDPVEAINQSSRIKNIRSDFTQADPATRSAKLKLDQERQRVLSHAKARLINEDPAVIKARAKEISRQVLVHANFAYFCKQLGFEDLKNYQNKTPEEIGNFLAEKRLGQEVDIIAKTNPGLKDKVPELASDIAFAIGKVNLTQAEEEAKSIDNLAADITSRHNIEMARTSIGKPDREAVNAILENPAARQALAQMLIKLKQTNPLDPIIALVEKTLLGGAELTHAGISAALQPSRGFVRNDPRVLFDDTTTLFNQAARQLPEVVAAVLDKKQARSPGVTADIVRRVDAQTALEDAQDKYIKSNPAEFDEKITETQASIVKEVSENNKTNALFKYYVSDTDKLPLVSEGGGITITYKDGRASVKLSPDEIRAASLEILEHYDNLFKAAFSDRKKTLDGVQYTLDSAHADFEAVGKRLKGLRSIIAHDRAPNENRERLDRLRQKAKDFNHDLREGGALGQHFVKPSADQLESAKESVKDATEQVGKSKGEYAAAEEEAKKSIKNASTVAYERLAAGNPTGNAVAKIIREIKDNDLVAIRSMFSSIETRQEMAKTIANNTEVRNAFAKVLFDLRPPLPVSITTAIPGIVGATDAAAVSALLAKMPVAGLDDFLKLVPSTSAVIMQVISDKNFCEILAKQDKIVSSIPDVKAAISASNEVKNAAPFAAAREAERKRILANPPIDVQKARAAARQAYLNAGKTPPVNTLPVDHFDTDPKVATAIKNSITDDVLDAAESVAAVLKESCEKNPLVSDAKTKLVADEEIEKTAKANLAKLEGVAPLQTSIESSLDALKAQEDLAETKVPELAKKVELIKEARKTKSAERGSSFGSDDSDLTSVLDSIANFSP